MSAASEAGYRVIAVDYRGHGLTRVTDFEFSIQHIADDLVALLDHLRIPAAVFGGTSKGGFVAAAVYDQHPKRVLGLLMADGGTWSNQCIFDHAETEMVRQQLTRGDAPPRVTKASEFEVFLDIAGRQIPATGDVPIEPLIDLLVRIGPPRPDWFVRDAVYLLDRVRRMPARGGDRSHPTQARTKTRARSTSTKATNSTRRRR